MEEYKYNDTLDTCKDILSETSISKNKWFQQCFEMDDDLLYILDFSTSDDLIRCIHVVDTVGDAYTEDEELMIFRFPKSEHLEESEVARIYKKSVGKPKIPKDWGDWFYNSRIVNPESLENMN